MAALIRSAVFPVAGIGRRLLPATKVIAKALLPVVDRPLLDYAVQEARGAGIERFIFITGRGGAAVRDYFSPDPALEAQLEEIGAEAERGVLRGLSLPEAHFIEQKGARGLGAAILCARALLDGEVFAVLLPDDLILAEPGCLAQMMAAYPEGGHMAAVQEIARAESGRYGILAPGREEGRLIEARGLIEKPAPEVAPSRLAVIGRYILGPEIFAALAAQGPGAGGEVQLTDALAALAGRQAVYGFRFEGERLDAGTPGGLAAAGARLALARPGTAAALRAAGVGRTGGT